MAGKISTGARSEVLTAVAERYRSAERSEKGKILDELCATTGWHRKHAVRALSGRGSSAPVEGMGARRRHKYDAIRDALTALWEASDRVCGKRLVAMIPILLPPLERHGRLQLGKRERRLVLSISAATIDHAPATPFERALAHPKVTRAVKAACGTCIARSTPYRSWPTCAPLRPNSASASIVVPARSQRDYQCQRQHSPGHENSLGHKNKSRAGLAILI